MDQCCTRPFLLLSVRRRRLLPPSDRGLRPTDRGLRPRSLREPLRRLLRDPDLRIFLRGVLLRDSSLPLGVIICSCAASAAIAAAAASAAADIGIGGLFFSKLSRALQ